MVAVPNEATRLNRRRTLRSRRNSFHVSGVEEDAGAADDAVAGEDVEVVEVDAARKGWGWRLRSRFKANGFGAAGEVWKKDGFEGKARLCVGCGDGAEWLHGTNRDGCSLQLKAEARRGVVVDASIVESRCSMETRD